MASQELVNKEVEPDIHVKSGTTKSIMKRWRKWRGEYLHTSASLVSCEESIATLEAKIADKVDAYEIIEEGDVAVC